MFERVKISKQLYKINRIQLIIIIYLILQPFLDVLTFLMIKHSQIDITVGVIVRVIFLCLITILYLFKCKSKRKKFFLSYFLIVIMYIIVFLTYAFLNYGSSTLFSEIKLIAKAFYFPIILVCLVEIIQEYKIKIHWIVVVGLIYYALLLIAHITKTGQLTSDGHRLGTSGWFYSPNEIGTIIGILFPIVVIYIIGVIQRLRFSKLLLGVLIICLCVFAALNFGTKVPMVCILVTFVVIIIINLINIIVYKEKKYSIKILILAIVLLGLSFAYIPFSPAGMNIEGQISYMKTNDQSNYKAEEGNVVESNYINEDNVVENIPEITEDNNEASGPPVSSNFLIYTGRDVYNENIKEIYQERPLIEKIIGMGYLNTNNKNQMVYITTEMDFHDVFYRYGILGFIIWFTPLLVLVFLFVKWCIKGFKHFIHNYTLLSCCCGIVLALTAAFIAGHVLTAPAVSIYVAMFFANANLLYKDENREASDLKNS